MPEALGDRRILAPVGALHGRAIAPLLDMYFGVIEDGAHEVWLDLSDVTAFDGPALDIVARIAAFSHELECLTLIVCPAGNVRRALSGAGIDQDIDVYDNLLAARHAIASRATLSRCR